MDKFKTTLLGLGVKNRNGRVYTKECVENMISKIDSSIVMYGQIGYSIETVLKNVSHTINNIQIEDDYLVGDITILSTHNGKVLRSMIDDGL